MRFPADPFGAQLVATALAVAVVVTGCQKTYAPVDVVGVVTTVESVHNGLQVHLADGRTTLATNDQFIGFSLPQPGSLLLQQKAPRAWAAGFGPLPPGSFAPGCYLVPGTAYDDGEWIDLDLTLGDLHIRFPKAADFTAIYDSSDPRHHEMIGIEGLCVDSKGVATSYH